MSLKSTLKKTIIKLLPDSIKTELQNRTNGATLSYAQEGEDRVLERFFDAKENGFFVDIGAHHPTRFSNTYLFYQKGWRGINIDATPDSMTAFNDLRPDDINIEIGISATEGTLTYHLFNDPALNTFSKERVNYLLENTAYKLTKTVQVKTKSLKQILNECIPEKKEIDFLTIDVEGLDFEILQTNDWNAYKPNFLLIEDLNGSLENITDSKLYAYLHPLGYSVVAKTLNTLFFKRNAQL